MDDEIRMKLRISFKEFLIKVITKLDNYLFNNSFCTFVKILLRA